MRTTRDLPPGKDGQPRQIQHTAPPFRRFFEANPDEQLKDGPPTTAEDYAERQRQAALQNRANNAQES